MLTARHFSAWRLLPWVMRVPFAKVQWIANFVDEEIVETLVKQATFQFGTFLRQTCTHLGHPIWTFGIASHHIKNKQITKGFLKCSLKFQSFQPPISDELLPCKNMSSGRGLCTERVRGRLAQWLWSGKEKTMWLLFQPEERKGEQSTRCDAAESLQCNREV